MLTRRLYDSLPKREVVDGVEIRRLGYRRNRVLSKLSCVAAILGYLWARRKTYDIVMAVPCVKITDLLPAYLASLLTKRPYFVRATAMNTNFSFVLPRSAVPADKWLNILVPSAMWARAMHRASRIVVPSEVIQRRVVHFGFDRPLIIPNGADTERFRPASAAEKRALRDKLGLEQDATFVITTGRYVHPKNQMVLIRAFERLYQNGECRHVRLLILGATEEKQVSSNEQTLKTYVRRHALDRMVHFYDDVTNVPDFLRASDIFVLPTKADEGMSNALLEAMSCGLAVVTSDLPQVACTQPASHRLTISPDDVEALAAHLRRLLADAELRGANGRSQAEHIHRHHANNELAKRYHRLIAQLVELQYRPGA